MRWVLLLVSAIILGVSLAYCHCIEAINISYTNELGGYTITLSGDCLTSGQLTVEVAEATKTTTQSQLRIFNHSEPLSQSYSISGSAIINGQTYQFEESDSWGTPGNPRDKTHRGQWQLTSPDQIISQDFKFAGDQKIVTNPASCN